MVGGRRTTQEHRLTPSSALGFTPPLPSTVSHASEGLDDEEQDSWSRTGAERALLEGARLVVWGRWEQLGDAGGGLGALSGAVADTTGVDRAQPP